MDKVVGLIISAILIAAGEIIKDENNKKEKRSRQKERKC